MAKYSSDFGAAVQEVLGKRSDREVSRLTDGQVSHTLINEIRKTGYVPGIEVIVHIAEAVGADPNWLLDAAGKYRRIRYILEDSASVGRRLAADLRSVAAGRA